MFAERNRRHTGRPHSPNLGLTRLICQETGVNLPQRRGKTLEWKRILARWMRERMAGLHIENAAQLARRLGGLDRRMVGRWLSGERSPSGPNLERLIALLGPLPGSEGHDLGLEGSPEASGVARGTPVPRGRYRGSTVIVERRGVAEKLGPRPTGQTADGVALSDADRLFDLFRWAEEFSRRMSEGQGIHADVLLATIDQAEEIYRERGIRGEKIFEALREQVRRSRAGGSNPG